MDEPFSALDYQTRLSVSDDVYNIIQNEKKSAIMVTHDIAEAISMADKIIVLSKRPCHIKKIIDIKLTDKSNPINNRKAPEFSSYYEMIWKAIDHYV
jgi:NitT/TauT family transport system ATP-binding protein